MTPRTVPPRTVFRSGPIATPAPTSSFWVGMQREGFTAYIQQAQAPRLRGSRFGQLNGKPFTIEEVSR